MSQAPPELAERLDLPADVYRGAHRDGRLCVVSWRAARPIGQDRAVLRSLLSRLAGPAATEPELLAHLESGHGPLSSDDRLAIRRAVSLLRSHGWLRVTVTYQGRAIHRLVPVRRPPGPPPGEPPPNLALSRFALLRREGAGMLIESPRAWCRIELHDPVVLDILAGLLPAGATHPSDPPYAGVAARVRQDLWWAGIAVAGRDDEQDEEDELALRQWSPHELWFHDRSRVGRSVPGEGFGGTWWAQGRFDPLPAHPAPSPGRSIELARPDLDRLRATDAPLTEVLERRRTVREHDHHSPITAEQVGELLYRCARDRGAVTRDGVEYVSRPYPSGGSMYELELYPVAWHVAGLERGMYRYDPRHHRLEWVSGPSPAVRRMLRMAGRSTGQEHEPQVLLVIAARFGRVMWKYQQMSYRLVLAHVGVLYQTVCLVAAAMGLAACPVGSAESDAFAEATGLDPLAESSVGEVTLGTPPADGTTGRWPEAAQAG